MPVNVSQTRNGERIKVPWSWWHFGIMMNNEDLRTKGVYVQPEDVTYAVDEAAIFTDGEEGTLYRWEIKAGDILEMWRDR